MSISIKKLWNDYGIGGILLAIIVVYILYMFYNYVMSKGYSGSELMTQERNPVYNNSVSSSDEGNNEVFSDVNNSNVAMPSCDKSESMNPSELLPKDTNSQWAQLNPVGQGDLANINLLKAGYHIGIDTVGQTLRNANLQIRSEPPNPQVNVGIWNNSTIEPDFMRPSLELGQGYQ